MTNIQNPYNQLLTKNFGKGSFLPVDIELEYVKKRGETIQDTYNVRYPARPPPGASQTKAGNSYNKPPSTIPVQLVGIKQPRYSTATGAPIENERVGRQLGSFDEYRDTPYNDWTSGTQYYTIYEGTNPKTNVPPVIYPQAWRPEIWAKPTVNFPQLNREYTQDITDLEMDYSCKSCDVASAGLGTPVFYQPHNPTAPLPVQPPGTYPNIGYYTGKEIRNGRSTRDYPPEQNPIVMLQRRNAGLPNVPILPDYTDDFRDIIQDGFVIT
jgi:hypothetical protein